MKTQFQKISKQIREIDPKRLVLYRNILSFFITPFLALYMLQTLVPFVQNFEQRIFVLRPFRVVGILDNMFIINYLFFVLLYGFLFFLPKFKITASLVTVLFFMLGFIQHQVVLYKNSLIFPNDIHNIMLLRDISAEYSLVFNRYIFIAVILMLATIASTFLGKTKQIALKKRLIYSIIPLLLVFVFVLGFALIPKRQEVFNIHYNKFNPINNLSSKGLVMTYFYLFAMMDYQPPENYSEERAVQILDEYARKDNNVNVSEAVRPDILFIVNESLTNYEALFDLELNQPAMPYYNALEGNNMVKMSLFCSVAGGGTANTEFEILTGHSLFFFSEGAHPFMDRIKTEMYSFIWTYVEAGYRTMYVHPYGEKGWNRDEVIPSLGFEDRYYIDDFDNPEMVRSFVADAEAYRFVINKYEEHKLLRPDQPIFQYLLTMQNHGGYLDEEFEHNVELISTDDYSGAEQFLSLMNISDRDLEELIAYFEKVEDPILIVYFGDHQPSFREGFFHYIGDNFIAPYDPAMQRYLTPIMYWANFDLSSFDISQIETTLMSPNYIIPFMSDITGVSDPYMDFLRDFYYCAPGLNARGFYDAQNVYHPIGINSLSDTQLERLNEYAVIQHYLFGREYIFN